MKFCVFRRVFHYLDGRWNCIFVCLKQVSSNLPLSIEHIIYWKAAIFQFFHKKNSQKKVIISMKFPLLSNTFLINATSIKLRQFPKTNAIDLRKISCLSSHQGNSSLHYQRSHLNQRVFHRFALFGGLNRNI